MTTILDDPTQDRVITPEQLVHARKWWEETTRSRKPKMDQKPSVGRIVHFYQHSNQTKPVAAIVTDVHSDTCVNLTWLGNYGNVFGSQTSVLYNESDGGMRWCWPPRV